MGFFSSSKKKEETTAFQWVSLESETQLEDALSSKDEVVFIFKDSTRCPISVVAKKRFEREWTQPDYPLQLLYLDLLNYRSISSKVEELTGVKHQSPQLIVVKNGKVLYQDSHNAISAQESINKGKE